ncbi:MAG: NAD(P)-dependent oxidoreductase [Bacteroidota bacterium]
MHVLIIDDVHPVLNEGLEKLGFEVVYMPNATRNDLLFHIPGASGLVVRTKTKIDAEVINASNRLKFIARAGAGLDNVDEAAAAAKNIAVFNAGEANADAVGEHTLAMMLNLFTRLNKADEEVRSGKWDREGNRGEELSGKTVGIIGFGNTGKAVAKKLRGFDVEVLAYDKYLTGYGNGYVKQASMDEIYEKAEVVTFHIPLTEETKGLVNGEYLKKFKKDIWLFNLCRGEILVTEDLVKQLEDKKIRGVGLDVLENEKLNNMNEDEKLWFNYIARSQRTVLSPHVAGWSKESYYKISAVLLEKIKQLNLNGSVS